MKKEKVIITSMPRDTYFQWFILGFYQLKKEGKIQLEFKVPIFTKILTIFSNEFICSIFRKIRKKVENDSYNLDGYVIDKNGNKKCFSIDSADSPFLFDSKKLDKVDCYFKMQCPIEFNKEGFWLNDDITIPWLDHSHINNKINRLTEIGERKECKNLFENISKINPLCIGTRRLSKSLRYSALRKGYKKLIKGRKNEKSKRIMCYFGNAKGPVPNATVNPVDFDSESNILGIYADKINHPNEKRKIISGYIDSLGKDCDARIIEKGNSDIKNKINKNLEIPLKRFGEYVGNFQYNCNVSGYRLSIPNRFMDSLSVGTAIITDKLHVKWYLPFDDSEVVETEEMGYQKNNKVNWKKINKDIKNLPNSKPKKIITLFEKKWNPKIVATYIIETILKGWEK